MDSYLYNNGLKINKRLNAFLLAKQKGIEEACEMYPSEAEFIKKNKERSFEDVRLELLREISN